MKNKRQTRRILQIIKIISLMYSDIKEYAWKNEKAAAFDNVSLIS